MSKSRRLSSASARCLPLTLDWRPSRQAAAMLALLGLLAPFSLLASDLPLPWSVPLATTALLGGLRSRRRYGRRAPETFLLPMRGPSSRNGRTLAALEVHWRGPLAFLHWREPGGTQGRAAFFPDTLDARLRRELKLALQRRQASGASAAPAG